MSIIEKHLVYTLRSKKLRKHYKRSYESGPASWASCLLLMSSSSRPSIVQFPLFDRRFKVNSVQQSSLQTSPVQGTLEVGINLRPISTLISLCMSQLRVPDKKVLPSMLETVPSVIFQFWLQVVRHLIFIQRWITEISFRNKLKVSSNNLIKFYITIP